MEHLLYWVGLAAVAVNALTGVLDAGRKNMDLVGVVMVGSATALGGGTVRGPELNGTLVEGGVDWQVARADGALEIAAHYVIRTDDGALVEVQSQGLRHGTPEIMARLAAGEPLPRDAYFFRTLVRFTTGAPAWAHLNKVMALAVGQREARAVLLDLYRIT